VAAVILPADGKSYAVLGAIAAGYALTAVGYAVVSRSNRFMWDRPAPIVTGVGRPEAGSPR
jgi:hypothetical protein